MGAVSGALALGLFTALKLVFVESIGTPTPFFLYFAAVLLAAYRGGVLAGSSTTLLAVVLSSWLFIPSNKPFWSHAGPQVLVFVVECLAITLVTVRFVQERQRAAVASNKVKSTRDKLELVLQGMDEGVTVQDGKGRLVYANQLAATLVGCESAEELLKTPPRQLLQRFEIADAEGKPFPAERLPGRKLLAGQSAAECRLRFRTLPDGEERWAVVRASAIRNRRGKIRFVINLFQDVTAQQKQEEALALAREWFEIALLSIGDAVITTDERGRINSLNPVAEALTGWSSEQALERPLYEVFNIINEDTRLRVESPVERVLREGVVVGLANHTLLVRRDGSEIAIDDSAAPIRATAGDLRGVILVFRDVTAKRAAERRQAFLTRAVHELSSSLDYRTTLATVARLAVPLIADWCAVDILEEGQLQRLAVAHVDPSKIQWVQEIQRRYPSDPDSPRGVHQILRTGESEMLSEIPAQLLDDVARDEEHRKMIHELGLRSYIGVPLIADGTPFGVITLVMAETHRRYDDDDLNMAKALADRAAVAVHNARLFGEAESARQEAVLANRAKDEFLAMLGHELRNPLAPIRTAIELIQLRPGAPHEREHAVIGRQVRHLVRLVDDLLDVSRITRGLVELDWEPVDLMEVVERAREMVWPEGTEPAHTVEFDVGPGLVVRGDVTRLAQILSNLLTNAVKYTQAGGHIWVEARREGPEAVLSVRDDGMGIGVDTLRRVFDMFVQEPQALDRAHGGLGVGLSIVRGLVSAHGGRVSAHSDGVGRGAVFVVRLPLDEEPPATRAFEPVDACSPEVFRILIVDDNEDARELLAELLSRLGHQTYTAASAGEALNVARREQPSAALLDIGLPDLDGYELGRQLRALEGLGGIKLIATTGYGQSADRDRSLAAGFVAHLVKPVAVETLKSLFGIAAPVERT